MKKKKVNFSKEMNEIRVINKIEVNLSQEKIDFINEAYQKELKYWEKVALESVLTENEESN